MIRNVSLLTKRKKSDSPGKLTKALSPIDAPGSHPGMGDRSVNASSFFPSASNSCANLAALASPIQVGQAGLTRGVVSLPGMDVHMIQPRSGDELEEGGNKVWCEALINGELSALAAQLKNEIGWDIDREIDDKSHTGLMFAAQEGRDDIVRLLLNNGADLKKVDAAERSSLMWAAMWGRESTVTMLLDRGAPVDVVDCNGWTALMYASHFGFESIVESLLDSGAKYLNTDRKLPSPLQLASRNGFTGVAEKLVERYPQAEHLNWADFRGWSALIEAGANGKLDTVRFLLDKGANIMATDENRRNVLHVASLRGHLDVVRFLLNLKKELVNTVDAFGATPLLLALDQARSDVAAHLVSKDADIKCHDREGFTPAHVATLAGTIDTLKLLCTKDKSVLEAKDFRGRTPMLLAAAQGNLECVKFLVLQGSDLRTSDRLGRNAVMLAAAGGYAQIVRYLLDKQPGLIDLTDENCNPALDLATAEQVRVLLAKAYPAEHYVIARLNKINARTQQLATVQSGFTGSDDDFDSIRATMRKNRPEKVLQFVTRVLASAITRPLSDFETVDPPVNKIEALQARVVGIHENASIEEQVDAVRHRGRALIMMHQRCYNRQQVADAVAGCIEADTRKPVLASIEDLEQQISNWQREKRTLAEERAAYQTGLEELIKLIEPLKTRFKLPLEKTPELVSLSQFEGVIGNQADAFHTDFDQTTSRLAEDVRMLQTILNIVDVQSAQMRTKFQHDLAEGVREFDEAKAVYETAWSNVRGQVQQSYEVVSKQFADTSAQFEMINAQNPLGEIRKSYLTVLNRLENDKAFHERLLERLSQVQEEVVQLDATPISASAGESEKYKSVFRFEHDARVVAQGAECQGSASELIAPVLKASSVTEMVVPPELLVESEAPAEEEKVDTVEDHAAEAAPTARIITITPFSRGNSLQEIPIAPAENLTHSTSEISPAVSEASDVTISGPPPLPGRPKDLSIAPEGMTSIIPARLMQQLATAEPGSSASIRAVRETHSVAKMLKQFEAAAAIAEDPVPSPRPKSRSVSVSRQTQQ